MQYTMRYGKSTHNSQNKARIKSIWKSIQYHYNINIFNNNQKKMKGIYEIVSPEKLEEEILRIAKKEELNLRPLYKKYDIPQASVYHYINGKVKKIEPETYKRFKKMGVDVERFFQ